MRGYGRKLRLYSQLTGETREAGSNLYFRRHSRNLKRLRQA